MLLDFHFDLSSGVPSECCFENGLTANRARKTVLFSRNSFLVIVQSHCHTAIPTSGVSSGVKKFSYKHFLIFCELGFRRGAARMYVTRNGGSTESGLHD